ncbi:cell division protein PerM [Planctomonas psychrotolerans]|uniref:cell division protein PerM n=1 Tax=Planctomonas psychrotolerans TaxID=2528712 RepID=UPI00123BC417|nr:DUF6350 family protein [Planctomonas psychrotolerans]
MNRATTALFAGLESLLVVAIGIGIPLVPLTVLWATQYDLQIDWAVYFRAAADVWLLGHGVDLSVVLDPAHAAALALPGADAAFSLTIAPLGFALLTLLLGMRAGRRVGETRHRLLGLVVAVVVFALLALAVSLLAQHPNARPAIGQGTLLPAGIFGVGVATGARLASRRRTAIASSPAPGARVAVPVEAPDGAGARLRRLTDTVVRPVRDAVFDRPAVERSAAASALVGGTAAALAVVAAASVVVAVLLATGYASVITLYQSLQVGVTGGIALTLAQLALLPNLVLWAASWLVGPGFAIGTGSSVSPLGTVLGPLPALPVLGPLPQGELTYGLLGLLVPVLAGFLAALALQPRVARHLASPGRTWPWYVGAGLGIGLVAAVVLAVLTALSGGSAGPGRLVDVGPAPFLVLLFAFLEIGLAATGGMLVGARRRSDPAPR